MTIASMPQGVEHHLGGRNVIVLDLETAHSAEDCRYCGASVEAHGEREMCRISSAVGLRERFAERYTPIGWSDKAALGLSIGCYYDYRDSRLHWFDMHTLERTVQGFVDTGPLLVSFNGRAFDFPLMCVLLRKEAARIEYDEHHNATTVWQEKSARLGGLCDAFKRLCATSYYDILAEIWRVDGLRKFERGLNSLDALSWANGLGAKEMTGAQAPRLWKQGRYAEVIGHCQGDVEKTKALFEMVCAGQPILRGDGQPISLRLPAEQLED